jgi:hypothetical protein
MRNREFCEGRGVGTAALSKELGRMNTLPGCRYRGLQPGFRPAVLRMG